MKNNKKTLIISVIICLLPIILGIVLYNKLPEQMPIHFNISNEPDNYASKNFALFGIPIIMAIVQAVCCLVQTKVYNKQVKNNIKDEKPKVIKIFEWFIPIMTVFLYIIMIEVPLGSSVYVGKSVCLILGVLFIILGNYMPKMSYEYGKLVFHPMPKNENNFRKMVRTMGYSFIIIGIILLILIIWV